MASQRSLLKALGFVVVLSSIAASFAGCSSGGTPPVNDGRSSQPTGGNSTLATSPATLLDFARMRANAPPISTRSTAAFNVDGTFDARWTDAVRTQGSHLLYVSDVPNANVPDEPGTVDIYSEFGNGQRMIGQITGLYSPSGLVVDESNNLYVTQTDNGAPVLVFALGATKPFLRLEVPAGTLPTGVAVDRNDDVFVSTAHTASTSTGILVYKKGATKPYKSFTVGGDGISQIIADRDGNIYYAWSCFCGVTFGIYELKARTTTPIGLGLNGSGLFLDRSGDLVLLQTLEGGAIGIYPPGSTKPKATIPFSGFYQAFGPNCSTSDFFVALGSIHEYRYPEGRLVDIIAGKPNDLTFGVATNPAPPLPPPW
jgi:hypothetical protein